MRGFERLRTGLPGMFQTDFGGGYCTRICENSGDCRAIRLRIRTLSLEGSPKTAYCAATSRDIFSGTPLGGDFLTNPVTEENRYEMIAFEEPTAVVCFGGFSLAPAPATAEFGLEEPTPRFFPDSMGVHRNVFPVAGTISDALDISLDTPLTTVIATTLGNFPTPPVPPSGKNPWTPHIP